MIVDTIGLVLAAVLIIGCAFTVGYMVGHQSRKKPVPQVLMGMKYVENRRVPDFSRAERRAHKRRRG